VKGFAVTMSIGILISLFTAVAVVRVVMTELVYRRRSKPLHIHPIIRFVPENTNIHFMKARYMGIIVSAILSTASIVLFIKPGLNYGIDFKGGIQIEIQTQGDADMHTLRTALEGLDMGEMKLQEFGAKNDVMIRAERQPGGETAQSAAVATIKDTIGKVSPGVTFQRTEVVGPKISGELARSGSLAMILASLAITAYIWWRFEWPFAIGAIVTLVLDTTKTVGFFALTGLDFNLTAVAALLTLIGYSVNDKVVVYDRMRENMRLYKSMPLREIIDKSINQTLARSIYTSATAFLVMIPMAIWGGSAVNNFAIPMVFGIFIATSSSIFIAAPILLFIGDWRKKRAEHMVEQAAE
jgi:SecD/SecF fusion protein